MENDTPKKDNPKNTFTNIDDEYGAINSEDEFDQDNQSIEGNEEEETSAQLTKAFGSTIHNDNQEEVQEISGKQGLSPRGRK